MKTFKSIRVSRLCGKGTIKTIRVKKSICDDLLPISGETVKIDGKKHLVTEVKVVRYPVTKNENEKELDIFCKAV